MKATLFILLAFQLIASFARVRPASLRKGVRSLEDAGAYDYVEADAYYTTDDTETEEAATKWWSQYNPANNWDDDYKHHYNPAKNWDDDFNHHIEQEAKAEFYQVFTNAPNTWSADQWAFFAALMTLLGVLGCCFCLLVLVPMCCRQPVRFYGSLL